MTRKFEILEEIDLDFPAEPREKVKKMSRMEEFGLIREKYPDIPQTFLLKTDMVRRGITFTVEALEKLQDPYFEHCPHLLFDYHHMDNVTSYEIPISGYCNDGTVIGTILGPPENDTWTIGLQDDEFWIQDGDNPMEAFSFFKRPLFYGKRTESGALMQSIAMETGGDCLLIVPSAHCGYWNDDRQCRFCDMDYNTRHQMKMGREFKIRTSPDELYQTVYEAMKEKGKFRHFFLTGGTNPESKMERDVDMHADLVRACKSAHKDSAGYEMTGLMIIMSVLEEDQFVTLKEAGLDGFGGYLEIWDPERFKLICPGKASEIGHDQWLEKLEIAVKVFGRGNVNCAFVGGAEVAPPAPYGFEDIDEGLNSSLYGCKVLYQMGVVPTATNLFIEPGSYYYQWGVQMAPLEFYIKLDLGRHRLARKYGRGINCSQLGYRSQMWSCYPDYERLL